MRAWSLFALAAATLSAQGTNGIRGFAAREVQPELRLEQQAQAIPDTTHLRRYMTFMAAQPHNSGSPRSKAVADYILERMKEWGPQCANRRIRSAASLPYRTPA